MAFLTILAILGAAGVLIYAAVLRYRGRAIPRGLVRLGAGLEGASSAIGFLFFADPRFVALFLVVPAYVVYRLVKGGHRIAAGTLLLALGLPGAAWWGYYLVQDALDPLISYDAVLWLWWAPEVALLAAGAFLIAQGDRDVAPPTLFTKSTTQVREPAVVGSAIMRGMMIGPLPITVLVGVTAGLPVVAILLPLAVQAGVPWPLGVVGGAAAFAVVAVELGYLAIPPRLKRAWQGHALVGNPQMKRWLAVTGTPVPTSVSAMRRWLKQNPDRPETRWARSELLILTGDLAAAHTVIEAMPVNDEWDRFEQHALRLYLDWVEGADPDFAKLHAAAETIGGPDSAERRLARGEAMLATARDLAASGGDWMAPLIAYRDEAGELGAGLLRGDLRRVGYRAWLLYGLAASGVVLWTTGHIT